MGKIGKYWGKNDENWENLWENGEIMGKIGKYWGNNGQNMEKLGE